MSEFNIEVQGGSSVRLPTAGKYCDRDIIVTASGGGGTEEIENLIDQSGVLESTDGTATEKVERLIDKAEELEAWVNHFSNTFCAANPNMGAVFKYYTGTKAPKIDVSAYKTIEGMYYGASNLESIDFYLDYNGNSIYQLCYNTPKLKYIKGVNTSNTTFVNYAFYGCGVEEIEVPFDFSKVTTANNTFGDCKYLREIRFVPETIKVSISFSSSSLLSAESIQSIIDGLAYVTNSQNLTLHREIVLTDNQKQVINAKGWTLIQ